jgi:hypothetical protein
MSFKPHVGTRLFTIEQANATLPLVGAITADLVELSQDVIDRRHRLAQLTEGRDLQSGDPYDEELAQVAEELQKDEARVGEYVDELKELGIEPKSLTEGLVDFPSMMDGRLVYLCWKLGEDEVAYWHERDAGFAGRQPLLAQSAVAGGSPDADHPFAS